MYAESYQMAPWMIVLCVAIYVILAIANWRIFTKAGEKGWKAIIPIWNTFVLFRITWGRGILFLLLLIPFVDIVISIITDVKLARAYGKGALFALGLIFLNPIFTMILGFGSSEYIGAP